MSAGYFNTIGSFGYQFSFLAKLPTGDDQKMKDGYLVPLGTGSVDYSLGLTLTQKYGDYFFRLKTSSRLNSVSKRILEISYPGKGIETINYNIKNGDSFKLNLGCDYNIWSRLEILTALDLSVYFDGTTDISKSYNWNLATVKKSGISNKQEMTLADFNLGASYDIAFWEVGAYLAVPIYTKRETSNNEAEREMSFKLKVDYKLF